MLIELSSARAAADKWLADQLATPRALDQDTGPFADPDLTGAGQRGADQEAAAGGGGGGGLTELKRRIARKLLQQPADRVQSFGAG